MTMILEGIASLIPFLAVLGLVITIHELGHYAAGRWFGAAVESFSVGFGKAVFTLTDSRGTRWRINWLPLGGFVKFIGADESVESRPIQGKTFPDLHAWQRLVVALAGPFANFLLAAVIFAGLALVSGIEQKGSVTVASVVPGDPADRAGIRAGDIIVRAGGKEISTPSDVIAATQFRAGESVRYGLVRNGENMDVTIVPETQEVTHDILDETERVGRIGLHMQNGGIVRPGLPGALAHGLVFTGDMLALTHMVILRVVTFREPVERLRGPVGIWSISSKVTDYHLDRPDVGLLTRMMNSILALLFLAGLFSVGVGYFNLLPLPILDGGTVVGSLFEMIVRRPIPEKIQRLGLATMVAGLVCFALVVTWHDLKRVGLFDVFG